MISQKEKLKQMYKEVKEKNIKFIVMTGGVLSGLGKGVALASIGSLISNDLKKVPIKCDGYLNYDPGTLNPVEHGEVFVLDDGSEVDMDFGHYERFLNITCNGKQNLTMGKIYKDIIDLEREGKFLGKTVQLIPDVTNFIQQSIFSIALSQKADVVLLEIGGTIGDIENELYFFAVKEMARYLKSNIFNVHLTYVPEILGGEQKTKPAQTSLEKVFHRGLQPDVVLCRSKKRIDASCEDKLGVFSGLSSDKIISAEDVKNIYEIPLNFKKQNLDDIVCDSLQVPKNQDFDVFKEKVEKITTNHKNSKIKTIGICGKYTKINDSYASVIEAINHASTFFDTKTIVKCIDTENVDSETLEQIDGFIVPGGFGNRGVDGKINIIKYARENKKPFLGLCYGLQLAIIEYAKNVLNIKECNSTEIDSKTPNPIIKILPNQDLNLLGGTMRLGAYEACLLKGSKVFSLYNSDKVSERHRHRYEVNPEYHKHLEDDHFVVSGKSPDGSLVEFIELKDHPFFVATQSHPELKSRIVNAHPLFVGFLKAVNL